MCGKVSLNVLGVADVPSLSAPAEANSGRRLAREGVHAAVTIVLGRARDGSVECRDGRRRTVHDRGARVNDGLETSRRSARANDGASTGQLPKARGSLNGMILNSTGVQGSIGTTEVQLRVRLGQLESEHVLRNCPLLEGGVEPRALPQVGKGRVGQTKNPVDGIIGEAT